MEAFARSNPSFEELRVLNKCRLYLQVYFLSEICTGNGLAITEEAWREIRFEVPFKMLSWPSQQRPSPKEWTTWQLLLKKHFFTEDYVYALLLVIGRELTILGNGIFLCHKSVYSSNHKAHGNPTLKFLGKIGYL
jgi:hypothetical protein